MAPGLIGTFDFCTDSANPKNRAADLYRKPIIASNGLRGHFAEVLRLRSASNVNHSTPAVHMDRFPLGAIPEEYGGIPAGGAGLDAAARLSWHSPTALREAIDAIVDALNSNAIGTYLMYLGAYEYAADKPAPGCSARTLERWIDRISAAILEIRERTSAWALAVGLDGATYFKNGAPAVTSISHPLAALTRRLLDCQVLAVWEQTPLQGDQWKLFANDLGPARGEPHGCAALVACEELVRQAIRGTPSANVGLDGVRSIGRRAVLLLDTPAEHPVNAKNYDGADAWIQRHNPFGVIEPGATVHSPTARQVALGNSDPGSPDDAVTIAAEQSERGFDVLTYVGE